MKISKPSRWLIFILPWCAIIWFIIKMDFGLLHGIREYQLAWVIFLLIVMNWWVQALQSYLLIRNLGYSFSSIRAFQLLLSSVFLNYLPMKPGSVFRGYILKYQYNVSWSDYGALMLFRSIILIAICMVITIIGLKEWTIRLPLSQLTIIGSILLGSGLSLFHPEVRQIAQRVLRGLFLLISSPHITIGLCLLISIQLILISIRLKLCFAMLGDTPSFSALLTGAAAASVLLLTPLTPGAIGIREFGVAGILTAFSIPFQLTTAALILDRLFLVIGATLLGGTAYRLTLDMNATTQLSIKK